MFLQMCLSEIDGGKKFNDVEVEEIEAEVYVANAKDKAARTSRH